MAIEQVLLTRDQFRELVFDRDGHKCVICKAPGQDAHHIMERRLFPDEGYYLDNGATLCGDCHLRAERTDLGVKEILEAIDVQGSRRILPPHLYGDQDYDKWANPILPNGSRLRGELYYDISVRRALDSVLSTFVSRVKYPRTYHLPFSPGVSQDDRIMETYYWLQGYQVVVTEKMDGENTTWYRDYVHARSIDSGSAPWRDYIMSMWSLIAHDIPEDFRLCGENLYAKHSIQYDNLSSYFQIFNIWSGLTCLSWNETKEWCDLLGLQTVPVLYEGPWDEELIMNLALGLDKNHQEGLVVRAAQEIQYGEFRNRVGKYVRENHVQTHGHWTRQGVIPNKLGVSHGMAK